MLASSSPFRKALLERLHIEFSTCSPELDEKQLENETVQQMVVRLAEAKARRLEQQCPEGLIIGSDQAVECEGTVLGKPHNYENARAQLQQMSGKTLTFHTGLCLLNTCNQQSECDLVDFEVTFRELQEQEIERYLQLEQPYNCAGSFKSEQLGISLLQNMRGDDPTALIGLPLIRLSEMLRGQGISVP